MHTIRIQIGAGANPYEVIVGSGLLSTAGPVIADKLQRQTCAIVTDTNIERMFASGLRQTLVKSGIQPIVVPISPGERSKSLNQVADICDRMLAARLDRQSFIIAVGGGVIGDIAGFAAAIFHRGIPYVQIPTTLLAMVDSSIGGKTGVNMAAGKNLIGAIHQPALVLDDVAVLRSLPEREFKQGFAEIIKHGVIADGSMFDDLKAIDASELRANDAALEAFVSVIQKNIEIKARFVVKDELDRTGNRALLNFGHTVGHGIERACDYKRFFHGEAISLGMVAALNISMKRAGLSLHERDAIIAVLRRFDLPTELPQDFSREKILDALQFDKKFEHGQIRFVVTPKIGSAYLSTDVTLTDLQEAVDRL